MESWISKLSGIIISDAVVLLISCNLSHEFDKTGSSQSNISLPKRSFDATNIFKSVNEWADPKKDQKVADKITKGLDRTNKKLESLNAKLDKKIAKAKEKRNAVRVNRLTSQKDINTKAITTNNQTKTYLKDMNKRDDSDKGINNIKYTFKVLPLHERNGKTGIVNGVVTISVIAGNLGNQAHEVTHGADIGQHRVPLLGGLLHLDADGIKRFEIRGYQAQFAADPRSMP